MTDPEESRKANGSEPSLQYIFSKKDNAKMVLIPAGEFLMGSQEGDEDEKPLHKVHAGSIRLSVS